MERLSGNAMGDIVLNSVDIGGAAAQTALVDMLNSDSVYFNILLGNMSGLAAGWDGADILDTCRLVQATSSAGAGLKNLGTALTSPALAAGNKVVLEAKADQLDHENGFRYVGVSLAETGNTGVDYVTVFAVRFNVDQGYYNVDGATAIQRA
jgi:hypothetical protein